MPVATLQQRIADVQQIDRQVCNAMHTMHFTPGMLAF